MPCLPPAPRRLYIHRCISVSFLLKLSNQWVKYVLQYVLKMCYIDLHFVPIGEMKKNSESV